MELTGLTIEQAGKGLRSRDFSAKDLAKAFLDRINSRNEKINAYITVCEKEALSEAENIDKLLSHKADLPLLAGIPCAIKDIIMLKGVKCTAASKILENYTASYDAGAVKFLKEQGTVMLGKANLDEFAVGSSGEHSAFGKTLNPRDETRVPGGSSSGSAAAVADDLCIFALGSDTGGSVRLPASFCGVVGFKPSYGAVSRSGLMAMASSLDQVGILSKSVNDAKTVLRAISKKDPMDSTSLGLPEGKETDLSKLKIGFPKEYFIKGMDAEVEKLIRDSIKKLEDAGSEIREISLPHTKYALATYYIIMPSELSANLARFDGIKYGFSKEKDLEIKTLLEVYLKTRQEGFGEEVRRRIMLGTYSLSAGYYDAYYLKAQKVRTLIRQDFKRAFEDVDLIVSPTSPTFPFKIGEKTEDPVLMSLSDVFTISANLAGLPAVSLPVSKPGSLPTGLQIMGKPMEDYGVLSAAAEFEEIWKK